MRHDRAREDETSTRPADALSSQDLARLEQLATLRERGALTDGEFEEQKRRLLEA